MKTAIKSDDSQHVMEELLQKHDELVHLPEVGTIIEGRVVEKSRHALYVDLGIWGLGVVYGRELREDPDIFRSTNVGDEIQATVVRFDNEEDCIELSLRSATRERNWEDLRQKLEGGEIFETEVLDANRGGLIVRIHGIMGFLPVSQLAPDHYPRVEGGDPVKIFGRLKDYVGQGFRVKVITADQDSDKLIVSEKAAVGDELSDVLTQLKPGTVVAGVISGVVDFGVFVKFEESGKELEGLVHISELAWQRIDNPLDFVRPGDKVQAKVIEVDGLRISLSMKQLKDDPWGKVHDRYHIGDVVEGYVLKVTPFGAFVKLDDDIHGLAHVSEFPEGTQHDPDSVVKVGDTKSFTIISLEPENHRLGLSLKSKPRVASTNTDAAHDSSESSHDDKPVPDSSDPQATSSKAVKGKSKSDSTSEDSDTVKE